MDWSCIVRDGSNDRHAVEPSREPGKMLGDPDAGAPRGDRAEWSTDLFGGFRLGIERLELAGTADQ
jgi:hypothetical protein